MATSAVSQSTRSVSIPTTDVAAFSADAITQTGSRLQAAGTAAAKLPMGAARAEAFAQTVQPILLEDAGRLLGVDGASLAGVLAPAVAGSGASGPTLGLTQSDKGFAVDSDYPPRAANAVWADFARQVGISEEDAEWVTQTNTAIGAYPKAEGKYSPALEALSPELRSLSERVCRSLLGEDVQLTSREQAFKANLVLNNFTWHASNWQKAAGDDTRTNPMKRGNVFNAYSDNLQYAKARGGLEAVMDMAVSDSFNAGKPGVGEARFAPVRPSTDYRDPVLQTASAANQLGGKLAPGLETHVVGNLYGA